MARQVLDHSADRNSSTVVDRYFEVSLLLMLATSFITLALTGKLDAPSKLVFCASSFTLWIFSFCLRGPHCWIGYWLPPFTWSCLSPSSKFFRLEPIATT